MHVWLPKHKAAAMHITCPRKWSESCHWQKTWLYAIQGWLNLIDLRQHCLRWDVTTPSVCTRSMHLSSHAVSPFGHTGTEPLPTLHATWVSQPEVVFHLHKLQGKCSALNSCRVTTGIISKCVKFSFSAGCHSHAHQLYLVPQAST